MKSTQLKVMAAAAFMLLGVAVWWAVSHIKPEGPKRQVAKIAILPDTPPPPPPPPKEEKKPEPPKDEPKQVMRDEPVKQAEVPKPANEPIKMEGAAGDGPSAFAAGGVSKEYSGGAANTGAAGTGGGTVVDRAQERLYANSARQMLRDEIERRLKSEAEQLTATFAIWLDRDGAIQRYELTPTGDVSHDKALRLALDETSRQFKLLPPPNGMNQPMRFRLSVRPQA